MEKGVRFTARSGHGENSLLSERSRGASGGSGDSSVGGGVFAAVAGRQTAVAETEARGLLAKAPVFFIEAAVFLGDTAVAVNETAVFLGKATVAVNAAAVAVFLQP
jgi:hypothetical protein